MLRVLDLAEETVRHFGSNGYTDVDLPGQSFHAEKPVAETAMLLHACSGISDRPGVVRRVQELASFLAPYARSKGVLIELALRPALAFKFAVPHILISRLGYLDPAFDQMLIECAKAEVRNGVDRAPTAELERCWIQSHWHIETVNHKLPGLLTNSVLASPLDVLGGLRSDTYAFTHMIMYASDFGLRSVRLPRARAAILEDASALLARYVDSEDYDLAGEILLSWPFLGSRWSAASSAVFRLLTNLEDRAGILPGGLIDGQRLARLEGHEQGIYALANSYHTSYVMGFICAAALAHGRAPPRKITGRRYPAELRHIERYVQRDQGHYHELFDSLHASEREALAPFLLDLAIAQCARRRDYDAMRQLLKLALDLQLASRPICGQAAELLTRLATCAAAIR